MSKVMKDLLTKEQLDAIQKIGLEGVRQFFNNREREQRENERRHLEHPFYKKVDQLTNQVAREQIIKGANTYDEPFNQKSWTPKELLVHQLGELRDAQVYGVGMFEYIEDLEKELAFFKDKDAIYEEHRKQVLYFEGEIEEIGRMASGHGFETEGKALYGVVNEILEKFKEVEEKGKHASLENVELRRGMEELKEKHDSAMREYEKALNEVDNKIIAVGKERDKYKNRCKDYEEKLNNLNSGRDDLEDIKGYFERLGYTMGERSVYEVVKGEIAALTNTVNQLRQEKDKVQHQYNASRVRVKDLEVRFRDRNEILELKDATIADLEKEFNRWKKLAQTYQNKVEAESGRVSTTVRQPDAAINLKGLQTDIKQSMEFDPSARIMPAHLPKSDRGKRGQ